MADQCDHIWNHRFSSQYLSWRKQNTFIGQQDHYYCMRDPNHTLIIPSDEEMLEKDIQLFGDGPR